MDLMRARSVRLLQSDGGYALDPDFFVDFEAVELRPRAPAVARARAARMPASASLSAPPTAAYAPGIDRDGADVPGSQ
jgi:hypothetical protein